MTSTDQQDPKVIARALAAPFAASDVKFKAQVVREARALAVAYLDVRAIQDRLDEVLGVDGWQDSYTPLPDGSVMCRLRCRIGERWVTKTDVGSPSEQPDAGDRTKAAFSDALKRAAVKIGCARYLYRLPPQWYDYDPVKHQFLKTPTLPSSAQPAALPAPKRQPISTPDEESRYLPAEEQVVPITTDQAQTLHDLMEQKAVNVDDFLDYYQIKAVGALPAAKYQDAFNALRLRAAGARAGARKAG